MKHILIVEDDDDFAYLIQDQLTRQGDMEVVIILFFSVSFPTFIGDASISHLRIFILLYEP